MAFLLLGNSNHVVFLVSIDLPTNIKQDALFHCIEFDYSHANWDSLCDHLRDVVWESIFKLSASAAVAAATEFCDRVQIGTDIYIIVSIRSNLTHLYGFQLLELLT